MAIKKNTGKTNYKKATETSPPKMRRKTQPAPQPKPGTSRGLPQGKPATSDEDKEKEARWARERYRMLKQAEAYRRTQRRGY